MIDFSNCVALWFFSFPSEIEDIDNWLCALSQVNGSMTLIQQRTRMANGDKQWRSAVRPGHYSEILESLRTCHVSFARTFNAQLWELIREEGESNNSFTGRLMQLPFAHIVARGRIQ